MEFNSINYIFIFLPITWLIYINFRHTKLNILILVISGYLFYGWAQPWAVILLFISSTLDFTIAKKIDIANTNFIKKMLMMTSVIFNIGLLCIFKYGNWIIANLNIIANLLKITPIDSIDIPLPPGISFYTFQSLSYVFDIFKGKLKPHNKLLEYLAFVAYFPQLVAGPIERVGHLLPQLVNPRKYIFPRIIDMGIFLILWGLFKKIVIADNIANLIQIGKSYNFEFQRLFFISLAFSFQIYADFSAYTDIARGSAKLFGIKLNRNFLTPYFAQNPSDFWKRWHISLSTWIRDYIYIGLGGSKLSKTRMAINLLFTMFLAGLWHGAGWYFIAWGIYHGILLVIYRIIPIELYIEKITLRYSSIFKMSFMFLFTILGWFIFYIGETGSIKKSFLYQDINKSVIDMHVLYIGLIIFAAPLMISDYLGYRKNREFVDLWPHIGASLKTTLYILSFYLIIIFGARTNNDFIYFQF